MEHRHIEIGDILTVTAAVSVLERGKDRDFVEMMNRLSKAPHSRDADNALVAAENAEVYGRSKMLIACIKKWRAEQPKPEADDEAPAPTPAP